MVKQTLAQALAGVLDQKRGIERCLASEEMNAGLRDHWQGILDTVGVRLEQLEQLLPSGSGFNAGTRIVHGALRRVVLFSSSYQYMNAEGYYDGWLTFNVRVVPDWEGILITVSKTDGDPEHWEEVSEYIGDMFHGCLTQEVTTNG